MLDVLNTINSRLQNADNSLVQNTTNNSEQQDLNSSEKINAAKTAFGRELTEAEKSAVQGLSSLQDVNQWADQKNQNWANLQQQKLSAAQTIFGRQLSDAEKAEVASLGSVQQVNDWAAQKGQEWLSAQQAASAAPAGGTSNVGISALDRFYDPVLKQQWVIESASDYGTIDTFNKPKGGGGLVYINPQTGEALDRKAYLQVANTPEAVEYRAEQERIAAENAKLFRYGNTLDNPLVGVTDYGKKLISIDDSQSGGVGWTGWGNKNVVDYFMESRPDIFGHTSTFVKPYKVVDGKLVEANPDDITPQDIANNAVYFYIGGATGGPNRERMAQLFQPNGEKLIPIGDPSFYKGESRDGWKDAIKTLAPFALMALPGLGGLGGIIGQAGAGIGATAAEAALIAAESGIAAGGLGAGVGTGVAGALASAGLPATAANIGANALVHGLFQGTVSDLQGGNFGKGFGIGALTGGLGSAASGVTNSTVNALTKAGLDPVMAKIAANSLTSAGIGGTLSAAQGKGFLPGAKTGAISGGISAGVNELGNVTGLNKGLGSLSVPARSLATSALTAKAMGRPFDFGQAAQNAAINYGLNQAINAGGQAAGFTPSQQKTLINFLNFAAPIIAARR